MIDRSSLKKISSFKSQLDRVVHTDFIDNKLALFSNNGNF
jgi:hypothetical protein